MAARKNQDLAAIEPLDPARAARRAGVFSNQYLRKSERGQATNYDLHPLDPPLTGQNILGLFPNPARSDHKAHGAPPLFGKEALTRKQPTQFPISLLTNPSERVTYIDTRILQKKILQETYTFFPKQHAQKKVRSRRHQYGATARGEQEEQDVNSPVLRLAQNRHDPSWEYRDRFRKMARIKAISQGMKMGTMEAEAKK